MRYFDNFEEACRASKQNKAVGTIKIEMPTHRVKWQEVDIIKPLNGDATIYYKDAAFPIRKAIPREVDAVKRWRPYV